MENTNLLLDESYEKTVEENYEENLNESYEEIIENVEQIFRGIVKAAQNDLLDWVLFIDGCNEPIIYDKEWLDIRHNYYNENGGILAVEYGINEEKEAYYVEISTLDKYLFDIVLVDYSGVVHLLMCKDDLDKVVDYITKEAAKKHFKDMVNGFSCFICIKNVEEIA